MSEAIRDPVQRVVIGTAGHIDHGKTTLLKALTGIDCDRWAEEKARGITIDLGFAHLEDGDLQIGFVDVPGHERFLHNALAGLGGIRAMLLVVAADEGVKPQTREHLAICELLGIPHAVIALTKKDLVDPDLLELAELELSELLESTPYGEAPIVPVSSTTGDGIDRLRAALVELAGRIAVDADPELPARLPVDRAFQLKGLGAVVTGTLVGGRLAVGDTLALLPTEQSVRVRSLQVHGVGREAAFAGERTAAQLVGVELETLDRGQQIVTPGVFAPTRSLVARLTLWSEAPEPLSTFVPVRFHLLSREVLGKMRALGEPLAPGASGLVEIRLAAPTVAVRGDRFIARRPSPATTLGGGEVLDPQWRRRRGKSLAAALRALDDPSRAVALWVAEKGERGATVEEIRPRFGGHAADTEKRLAELSKAGDLLRVDSGRGPRWIAPAACERVLTRARRALAAYFKDNRLARGMPKAELVERTLPRRARDLADVYLTWMEASKVLVRDGDVVNPPGRTAQLTGEESQLSKDLLAAVESEGLNAPSPPEMARRLGVKPQILEGVMRYLLERGQLARLPSGLIVAKKAIEDVQDTLRDGGEAWHEFTVAQFKDRFGLSRKWAIPLLEYLDSSGFTRRVGDKRQIVGKS